MKVTEEKPRRKVVVWLSGPMCLGYTLTLVVLGAFWLSLVVLPACPGVGPCRNNWDYLLYSSSPNEIGDTLAGFAGSLAFIWLIVTVVLQAKELKEAREEYERMADALSEQATLIRLERKERQQAASFEHFVELEKDLLEAIEFSRNQDCDWSLKDQKSVRNQTYAWVRLFTSPSVDIAEEELVRFYVRSVSKAYERLAGLSRADFTSLPKNTSVVRVSKKLQELCELVPCLSAANKVRASRLDYEHMLELLKDLLNRDIWEVSR